jgi:hypothetical protein
MSELVPEVITGLPAGVKEAGQRVDFKPEKYDLAIVTKGYRVWWSRATPCPCRNNDQTEQPDPTCTLCDGLGELLFSPVQDASEEDSHGNPIEFSSDRLSIGVDAIMTGLLRDPQIFERFGTWIMGTAAVSVQGGNELGFRDRLELRDATMVWTQLVVADGASTIQVGLKPERLRYRALAVNYLRSTTQVYRYPGDYALDAQGQVVWSGTPPADGTVLSIHYRIHPVYRVVDYPHVIRDTKVKFKTQTANAAEQHRVMPSQCMAKLDFLPGVL